MTELRESYPPDEVVTQRVSGAMPGMVVALTALVLVALAAFWAIGTQASYASEETSSSHHAAVSATAPLHRPAVGTARR